MMSYVGLLMNSCFKGKNGRNFCISLVLGAEYGSLTRAVAAKILEVPCSSVHIDGETRFPRLQVHARHVVGLAWCNRL